MNKKCRRTRRSLKCRNKIKSSNILRLIVNISCKHIYLQITTSDGSETLVHASTNEKKIRSLIKNKNKKSANFIGKVLSERAVKLGIKYVAFDRSGYKYHGIVKELADSARKNGLIF
ncbi:MAG: 50S ribosomal protein L18 [Enterobacteriaceae bacterium]